MQRTLQACKRAFLRLWPLLFLLAAAAVAAGYGLERIFNADFVCTNGDYQSYNVLRRVLAGQVPYRDFANYLGMCLPLLCAPLLALHNSFAGSLFVTHFVCALLFILFVTLVFYLVTGHKTVSMLAGLAFPKLLSGKVILGCVPFFGYYTDYYLGLLAGPSNSFRMGRMFWPVALSWLALALLKRPDSFLTPPEKHTLYRASLSASG